MKKSIIGSLSVYQESARYTTVTFYLLPFLPPASVEWGEGNSFSLLVFPHLGGGGTYPGQVQTGGYPKVGTPQPGQDRGGGGTPR